MNGVKLLSGTYVDQIARYTFFTLYKEAGRMRYPPNQNTR
jgi:hypothetical protein